MSFFHAEESQLNAMRKLGRSALFLLASLLLAVSQSGCNSDSLSTPTAPPAPRSPAAPAVVVTGAIVTMLVAPSDLGTAFPAAGEILVDGIRVWAGAVGDPAEFPWDCWGPCEMNLRVEMDRTVLAAGTHELVFRVTEQKRSPSHYDISGGLVLNWSDGLQDGVASWNRRWVRLRTGQDWTIPFTVPSQPPTL